MALMFSRLARNYIKNGYYPTDAVTIERALNAIAPSQRDGTIRVLDNCCGEGTALAECQHYLKNLTSARVKSYGVEYDKERAWHSKSLLDTCIHGDINDCVFGARQFGLTWLNPPYGDLVSDSDHFNREGGRKRMEKEFYRRTVATLQHSGIMILIIPHYSLDKELSSWISKYFENVRVYRAAEDTFKQVVIFGRRCKVTNSDKSIRDLLLGIKAKDIIPDELPEEWLDEQYEVPVANEQTEFRFYHVKIDPLQLADSLNGSKTLWDRFDILFNNVVAEYPRPLRKLSDWHLALALAAGQVSGVVESDDGRKYVIKGDTYKEKVNRVERSINDDSIAETRISTDRFVPVIKAIDFTPTSPTFGQILTIR